MKHPKYRVRDILVMAPEARDEAYDWVRAAVDANLPDWIKANLLEIQHVGSYCWGGARLSSDFDFNLCLKRDILWSDYAAARRWFYSPARSALARACVLFQGQTGLKVDIGLIDMETDRYNCYVSLREMVLHHRTTQFLTEFESGDAGPITNIADAAPIDLLTFNPATDTIPPGRTQHLKWDSYAFRWRIIQTQAPWKREAAWASDEWADEVAGWKARYGANFIDTVVVNGELVEDVPGS